MGAAEKGVSLAALGTVGIVAYYLYTLTDKGLNVERLRAAIDTVWNGPKSRQVMPGMLLINRGQPLAAAIAEEYGRSRSRLMNVERLRAALNSVWLGPKGSYVMQGLDFIDSGQPMAVAIAEEYGRS